MSEDRPHIAICHPRLGLGGSEARTLWLLQGLRETCRLTLVTAGPVDLARLNAFYGSDLHPGDFRVLRPALTRPLAWSSRASALRGALLERRLQRVGDRFDALVSGYNPLAFGRPAVQFIADFSWLPAVRDALHGDRSTPGLYKKLVARVRGRPRAPGPGDLLVANSHFAAGLLREEVGLECARVLHPPVAGPSGGRAWEQRAPHFLSLGRISPEKRLEDQLRILGAVRERGHDVRLTVLGGPTAGRYFEQLRSSLAGNAGWVTWRGWVEGEEKWRLLGSHRFALHTCRGEAFGISVAEMTRAGCLPFVPAVGGPAEIVAEPRLRYDDTQDAVEKIVALLEEPAAQPPLSEALIERGRDFGVEHFMEEARALIEAWLSGDQSSAAVAAYGA